MTSYGKNFDQGPHFRFSMALTFGTATYRPTPLHLREETVNLSRPREANPIASKPNQSSSVCAHRPCRVVKSSSQGKISGLTQKNSLGHLNIFALDFDVSYSTLSDLPGPLNFILT